MTDNVTVLREWFTERETTYDSITEAIWMYIASTILTAFADVIERNVQDIQWTSINLRDDILLISAKASYTHEQLVRSIEKGYFLPNVDTSTVAQDLTDVVFQIGVPLRLVDASVKEIKQYFLEAASSDTQAVERATTTSNQHDFDYNQLTADQTDSMLMTSYTTDAIRTKQ
jgi:hypothetical protein